MLGIGSVSKINAGPQVWQSKVAKRDRFRPHLVGLVLEYIMNCAILISLVALFCIVIIIRAKEFSWHAYGLVLAVEFVAEIFRENNKIGDTAENAMFWAAMFGLLVPLFLAVWFRTGKKAGLTPRERGLALAANAALADKDASVHSDSRRL